MGRVKELYFDLMEQKENELIDQGMDPDQAYDIASERAYHDLGDRMADMADNLRERQKENGS